MDRRSFLKTVGVAFGTSVWSRFERKMVGIHDPPGWPLSYLFYDGDVPASHLARFRKRGMDVAYARDVRGEREDKSKILLALVEKGCNASRERNEWGQNPHEVLLSASGKFVKAGAPVERIGLTEVGIKVVYK